jgi:hypothetical protein
MAATGKTDMAARRIDSVSGRHLILPACVVQGNKTNDQLYKRQKKKKKVKTLFSKKRMTGAKE